MYTDQKFFQDIAISLVLICSFAILITIGAYSGRYHLPGSKESSRACFVVQRSIEKTIKSYCKDHMAVAGSFEMDNGEKNLNYDKFAGSLKLTPEFFCQLLEEKYIQSIPRHPETNVLPHLRYGLTEDGTIFCLEHGFTQHNLGPEATAYEQLEARGLGIETLARASRNTNEVFNLETLIFDGIGFLLAVLLVLVLRKLAYDS